MNAPRPQDKRRRLRERPYSFLQTQAGKVFISWHGKPVTTLHGTAAGKFLSAAALADEDQAQLLMARVTGNFKRGNERKNDG